MNASRDMQQCLYLLQALKEITPNTYSGGEDIDYTLEGPQEWTTVSRQPQSVSGRNTNANYSILIILRTEIFLSKEGLKYTLFFKIRNHIRDLRFITNNNICYLYFPFVNSMRGGNGEGSDGGVWGWWWAKGGGGVWPPDCVKSI